jgi:hypothetical protein
MNRPETSGLAANLRRVATELRRSPPFRGLSALGCSRKNQQLERFRRDRHRAAIGTRRIQSPHEAVMRGCQRASSMRGSRRAAKFQCSEALVPGLCFAHGSNINSRDESCGKLKASGLCEKCLATKSGQAEAFQV